MAAGFIRTAGNRALSEDPSKNCGAGVSPVSRRRPGGCGTTGFGPRTKIKLLILDCDGVLTDGSLAFAASGSEVKTFNVQDGAAIRQWQASGGVVGIISGRVSQALLVRAKELSIKLVRQGVAEKLSAYETMCHEAGVTDAEVSFIGDDLPDLVAMRRCGYAIAVENAVARVKREARHVTRRRGGDGAVAEAIERLLRLNGTPARQTVEHAP